MWLYQNHRMKNRLYKYYNIVNTNLEAEDNTRYT